MAKGCSASLEPISVKIPEAVRLSGLSRSRIYELMKTGEIEFAKVGSSTLIIVESLRRFLLGRRAPQQQAREAAAPGKEAQASEGSDIMRGSQSRSHGAS